MRPTAAATSSRALSAAAASSSAAPAAPSAGSQRPFRILGLQQIALGGLDKSALSRLWVDTLGLTKTNTYKSASENVDEDILTLGRGVHAVEVDIMQPLDANKSPKVHIPALNHIGLCQSTALE